MKNSILYILLVSYLLLFQACTKEVTQEELIKSAVEIKLKQWRESQFATCRDKVLVKAQDYVDSLLLVTSLETKLDTIPKPEKPIKPDKPPFKPKPDSVIVKPIYKKD
jgi:hypothetical protein